MNKGYTIIFTFVLIAIITWMLLLSVVGSDTCPDTVPDKYTTCVVAEDCYFHPKYNCINYEPLNCLITEDLSARQQASDLIECLCISGSCFTRVKSTEEESKPAPLPPSSTNVTITGNITEIFDKLVNITS